MKQTITAKELLAKISNRYFRGAGLAKAEWLMLSGSGLVSIGICAGRATTLWMPRTSARRSSASTWTSLPNMSAAMRASARFARSRLWTATRAGWILSA